MSDFRVRFWGVRGAYAAPHSIEFGGMTPCVEVIAGEHRLIFDAGLGIIPLGRTILPNELDVTIFLSHLHRDHIEGFAFFAPLRYHNTTVRVYGPRVLGREPLQPFLEAQFQPPTFPLFLNTMPARREVYHLRHGNIYRWRPGSGVPDVFEAPAQQAFDPEDVVVRTIYSTAHPQGVFLFRVEWRHHSVVYATDFESYAGGARALIRFAEGADILIHDANYTEEEYMNPYFSRQGWGHSTPRMAIETAQAAGAKRVVLFHHDPQHDDEFLLEMERQAQDIWDGAVMAREGMVLDVCP
ncbi:hypothetical protein ARMA_2973 [Ardenticatena maritima]|uniref:Metallo-beta-lactamase domain-containing protein n=1 Tax=Ardenticatena maritima TaxID=872965 RepID=A0A0N0RFW6_9CHLR|nr:MBL fold metallo-hydrolase [Ardenticatena maritima]KPL89601.1 hypothetical protein SE16_04070 [Ardenticatena maritima]GAP64550.1 hypothetical protein ARMA_2973 [Ardenticatena maritima]